MADTFTKDDITILNALIAKIARKSDYLREDSAEAKPVVKKRAPDPLKEMLRGWAAKYAEASDYPSESELRRMYDVVQADARLSKRIAGLGFGSSGDAYRRAALKLRIMALMNVLRDGKNIRNDIVHRPGYVPSEQSANRALQEYSQADAGITDWISRKSQA